MLCHLRDRDGDSGRKIMERGINASFHCSTDTSLKSLFNQRCYGNESLVKGPFRNEQVTQPTGTGDIQSKAPSIANTVTKLGPLVSYVPNCSLFESRFKSTLLGSHSFFWGVERCRFGGFPSLGEYHTED